MLIKKIDAVARFIETFTVRRAINYKKFGASSIQYYMFLVVKKIRNLDLPQLKNVLKEEIEALDYNFDALSRFGLHQQNRKFVKHLLSRITAFIDESVGKPLNYTNYQVSDGKPFEIEHLWSNHYEKHKDEFEQEHEFRETRNLIGALILLPNGTNQSFNKDDYKDKLPHYLRENTFAQTLHPEFYKKNPNFKNSANLKGIAFKPYDEFKSSDIHERTDLVRAIVEKIWSIDYFI